MIRVVVADDHDLVRAGISRMIDDEPDMQVVAEAASGEEVMSICRNEQPDVVLMDVRMPGIGGLEATRKLIRMMPDLKIVAVTAMEGDPFPSRLLKAGALGFVTKGAGAAEMVQAIKKVHCGQRYICPSVAQQMALKSFSPETDTPFDTLTERELQIALMVVNCVRPQEIAEKLHLTGKTVNTYRYRIFEKLDVNSDVELTRLAIRHDMVDINADS